MNQIEFKTWLSDLGRKAPSLGAWVVSLPAETLREWFDEVFSHFELRDAEQVNREIRGGAIDLEGFRRDRLCSVFIRRCSELSHRRSEQAAKRRREATQGVTSRAQGVLATIEADPVTGPAYRRTVAQMRRWRESHPDENRTPDELVREWVAESLASDEESDREKQPRYRCGICCDTGYARTPCKRFVGHCKCPVGDNRFASNWRSGRRLGPAVEPVSSADF